MTLKEKEDRIKEIEFLIGENEKNIIIHSRLSSEYSAFEQGLKITLNGAYGALCNRHFVLFSLPVGSTITATARSLIQKMENDNENYWYNEFHVDKVFHRDIIIFGKVLEYLKKNKLNSKEYITKPKKVEEIISLLDLSDIVVPEITPIDNRYVKYPSMTFTKEYTYNDIYVEGTVRRKEPVSSYCDTDSLFLCYKPMLDKFNIKENQLDYVLYASFIKMNVYFEEKLQEYADKYKVKNLQEFELEQVSNIIMLNKKMYVKSAFYNDGIFVDVPHSDIQAKGIDIVRSSSPVFVKDKEKGIYKILRYFFVNGSNISDRDLVKILQSMKDDFMLQPLESICMTTSCSKYSEKVLDDKENFNIALGAHHGVKAGALHNYLLNNNPHLKQKYNLIKGGQKIKYYYTTNIINNEFGFISGSYPLEMSHHVPVDYNTLFEKTVLGLINRLNAVLGLSQMTPKLKFTLSVF